MKLCLRIIFFFIVGNLCAQNNYSIEKYKEKFFLYPTIGTDSALIYIEKVFTSRLNRHYLGSKSFKGLLLLVKTKFKGYE